MRVLTEQAVNEILNVARAKADQARQQADDARERCNKLRLDALRAHQRSKAHRIALRPRAE